MDSPPIKISTLIALLLLSNSKLSSSPTCQWWANLKLIVKLSGSLKHPELGQFPGSKPPAHQEGPAVPLSDPQRQPLVISWVWIGLQSWPASDQPHQAILHLSESPSLCLTSQEDGPVKKLKHRNPSLSHKNGRILRKSQQPLGNPWLEMMKGNVASLWNNIKHSWVYLGVNKVTLAYFQKHTFP